MSAPLLEVRGLGKWFPVPGGKLFGPRPKPVAS
mgnify:CR=1 FL=1